MSLMNLGLNHSGSSGPTIFALSLYVRKIPLLMFWCLTFFTNSIWIQRWLTFFNIFSLKLKFGIFHPNFKISFIVLCNIVWFISHSVSNRCDFSYIMIWRSQMGDIWQTCDFISGAPDYGAFIQCTDNIETIINEFWCHGIDRMRRDVHPTANIDIYDGTTT